MNQLPESAAAGVYALLADGTTVEGRWGAGIPAAAASPVVTRPDGVVALGARVKVAPYLPRDPFLRRLR
jgi:hypothetical protein